MAKVIRAYISQQPIFRENERRAGAARQSFIAEACRADGQDMSVMSLAIGSGDKDAAAFVCRFLLAEAGVVFVDESLERAVADQAFFKFKLLHLGESLIGAPAVVHHSVNRRHHARAVASAVAVNEYRLIGRVVNDLEKGFDLFPIRLVFGVHLDSIELHSGGFDQLRFVGLAAFL